MEDLFLLLNSPLEQFQNFAAVKKYYIPVLDELHIVKDHNQELRELFDYSVQNDYEFANKFFYGDNIDAYYMIIMLSIGISFIKQLIPKNQDKAVVDIFLSWLIAKIVFYVSTTNHLTFHYVCLVCPTTEKERQFDGVGDTTMNQFIVLDDHGGLLLTDAFFYFITAAFLLFINVLLGEINNTKGPYIARVNVFLYLQLVIYIVTLELINSSIDKNLNTQKFHVFLFNLFLFLTICNLQGLIPYNLTTTSHLISTFFMALAIIIFITILILDVQGILAFFSLFMPSGAPLPLGYLLVPIELISYFFKTVSLSVRLFANMMAGHTLLKVILGFGWSVLSSSESYFSLNIIPVVILSLLTGLELGVSVIQAYIFTILSILYLRDVYNSH